MEKVTINFFERFILNFAGFDTQTVIETTSAEKKRLLTIGLTLLVPIILGICSGGYAIYVLMGEDKLGWAFGLVYGCIIYLIDRAVLSITSRSWVAYFGRIVMSVIVGLVISFPIKLLVFKDTIIEELQAQNQTKAQTIKDKYKKEIDIITGEIQKAEGKVEDYHKAWQSEMDGSGGTQKRGRGNIADVKEGEYLIRKKEVMVANQLRTSKIDSLNHEMEDEIASMQKAHATGLLGQYKALGRVAEKEPFIKIATYLLWAFFTLLELIPLLVKIASSGNLYDKAVESNNIAALQSIENTNVMKIEAETLAQKKLITARMNQTKIQIAENEINTEAKMAEMYIKNIVEMSRNENKRLKELQKTELTEDKKADLAEKIANISDHYGERVYRSPFEKEGLYDLI